jgi:hypothetical protein
MEKCSFRMEIKFSLFLKDGKNVPEGWKLNFTLPEGWKMLLKDGIKFLKDGKTFLKDEN